MTTKQREYRYETTIRLSCVAYDEEEARDYFNEAVEILSRNRVEECGWVAGSWEDSTQAIRKADDQDFEYDERDAEAHHDQRRQGR